MGKRFRRLLIVAAAILLSTQLFAQIPANYQTSYEGLIGKQGASLFSALETIAAQGFSSLGYDGLYTAFLSTDKDANGRLIDMYSTCSFLPSDKCGNYNSVCDCYNREHSLPKSWWGGSKNNAYSDLFHLVPTDGKVNNQRGNVPFGECANGSSLGGHALGKKGSSTLSGYTSVGTVFEPDDQYKGDFARGYFGMLVRYGTTLAFTTSEGATTFSNSSKTINANNHFGLTNYGVALLMKWHRQDTVSAKETKRNTGIQATQGNRNPFIDCPILAEYLWGDKAGQSVTRADLEQCGCIENGGTGLEDVLSDPQDEASRLASVSATPTAEGYVLSCVPEGAQLLVIDAQGRLLLQERAVSSELQIAVPDGLHMIVLAIGQETRSIKVIR